MLSFNATVHWFSRGVGGGGGVGVGEETRLLVGRFSPPPYRYPYQYLTLYNWVTPPQINCIQTKLGHLNTFSRSQKYPHLRVPLYANNSLYQQLCLNSALYGGKSMVSAGIGCNVKSLCLQPTENGTVDPHLSEHI